MSLSALRLPPGLLQVLGMAALLGGFLFLQLWLLPRLGVPT